MSNIVPIKPTLDDLVAWIAIWQQQTFPHADKAGAAEHLRREARELWSHYWQEPFGGPVERVHPTGIVDARAEEMADIIHMLVQLAALEGIDLREALHAKLEKNKARKWKAPDDQGVIEHDDGDDKPAA